MPQWRLKKDKVSHLGLFSYPVLQSADILLFQPHVVPVGDDQKHHIDLARALCRKLNHNLPSNDHIRLPKAIYASTAKIYDLQEPTCKMSKSTGQSKSTIFMLDTHAELKKKIQKAVTDSHQHANDIEQRPGINNLCQIIAGCDNTSYSDVIQDIKKHSGPNIHSYLKNRTSDALNSTLSPIQASFYHIKDDDAASHLMHGESKASGIATVALERIMKGLSVWQSPVNKSIHIVPKNR